MALAIFVLLVNVFPVSGAFSVPTAHAAEGIYKPIAYQGKMALPSGVAIANGTYNMRFKIFTALTGGTAVWTETWDNTTQRVTMTGGLFTAFLGTHTAMSAVDFNSDTLYLQIEFDPGNDGTYEETFSPRRRFGSVPYALNADMVDGLHGGQFLRSDANDTATGSYAFTNIGIGISVRGTSSGKILHAQDTLSSSGSLVWEGAASGATLWVSSTTIGGSLQGAGLTDCDIASTSKLLWDATTGRFSCGSDQGGSTSYTAGQGLTLNASSAFSLATSFSGTALEILGTASGRILHAQDELRSSGTLITETTATIGTDLSVFGGDITGANGAALDLGEAVSGDISVTGDFLILDNSFFGLSSSTGRFEFDDQSTDEFNILNANVGIGTSTPSETLEIIGTASGTTLYASTSLRSSGSLVWEGSASGATLWVSSFEGAGLIDCDASTSKVIWDDTFNRFSCATDLNTGFTYTAGQGLTLNGSNAFSLSASFSGTALEILGTASGRTIFAMDTLSSSGNLIVESLVKQGSGAIVSLAAEYQTGAYIFSSGASVLALESYTHEKNGGVPLAPGILFGYKGVFDTNLYRTSGSTLRTNDQLLLTTDNTFNRDALRIDTTEDTSGQAIFQIFSDVTSVDNLVFKFTAGGEATADGSFTGGGADYAEYFYTSTPDLTFGEVVCIDVLNDNTVKRCSAAADPNVMGIVSSTNQAAFIGNKFSGAEGIHVPGTVLVGLIGQLSTKAVVESDLGSGAALPIRPGDPLTSSHIPGMVRRAKAGEPTVGVALSGLKEGEGRIDVLIARSNSSLAADTISDRVLQTINDLQIADEVELMVDGAMKDLDLEEAVGAEFRSQFAAYDLKGNVESLVERILNTKETKETNEQTFLRNLTISGSALIEEDLEVSGALKALSIEVQGDIITEGRVHAAALESESGATLRGRIAIEGDLIINGIPYGAAETIAVSDSEGTQFVRIGTGGAVDVTSLTIKDALYVLGDVTIEGLAAFRSDVTIDGNLTLSGSLTLSGTITVNRDQAGFALIPQGGTGVMVRFNTPMIGESVVTITPQGPLRTFWWVKDSTQMGFTIAVDSTLERGIIFSWHAFPVNAPRTVQGTGSTMLQYIPFSIDAAGYPLSSNTVWNACIRNQVQLDSEGQPFSCSRYHIDHIWTHPDLLIEFTWRSEGDPQLILPEGFSPEVQSEEESIVEEPFDALETFPEESIGGIEEQLNAVDAPDDSVEETSEESMEASNVEVQPDSVAEESVPVEASITENTEIPATSGEQIPDVAPVTE